MIIIDWGNWEETMIILRIEDDGTAQDFQLVSFKLRSLLMSSSVDIDLILDLRLCNKSLPKIVSLLDAELNNRLPNLNKVIVLATPAQEQTMHIISNFYPNLIREIMLVETVDDAYRIVSVA